MKTSFERYLPFLNAKWLLMSMRYVRFLYLLIRCLPNIGRPGVLLVAMPKSGSSFLEEYLSIKMNLRPLVASSTIYRESYFGDSHLVKLKRIDIFLVRFFGVLIKTHSLPQESDLSMLSSDQVYFLFRDPYEAAASGVRHAHRYPWHSRECLEHNQLYAEFVTWKMAADVLCTEFNSLNTESLEAELSSLFPDDKGGSSYSQILDRVKLKNPSHYEGMK